MSMPYLLSEAKTACGAAADTETLRLGLAALVRHSAYERLRTLLGTEPDAHDVAPSREGIFKALKRLMVLVDTSVWIRALSGRTPFVTELDRLLDLDEVAGHELIYGELLIGDSGGRRKALSAYEKIDQAEPVPHADVVAFVRSRRLYERGAGWIDIHLLTSAVIGRLRLWTADPRLSVLATELGVGWAA